MGRRQLVLDLSRKQVCDYIIDAVSNILYNSKITYVKWDMNRYMTDIWSEALEPKRQKETAHRYILGLYYMPQTWTSDNLDAVCRLKI